MKKLKLGFTLAEVATAMAIVGIVAALVMPLVAKGMQRQKSGPILGHAVEQITLGCQNMIQFANMNSSDSDGSQTDVLEVLREKDLDPDSATNELIISQLPQWVPAYWRLEPEEIFTGEDEVITIKNFDGSEGDEDFVNMVNSGVKYNFSKLPASVSIYREEGEFVPSDALTEDTMYYIFIDTTGWSSAPNVFGKDIFCYHLLNNGTLTPLNDEELANGLQFTRNVTEDGFRITYY